MKKDLIAPKALVLSGFGEPASAGQAVPVTDGGTHLQTGMMAAPFAPTSGHSAAAGHAMVPMVGQAIGPMPGQSINMSVNTPSPNLSFKEWLARGIVAGIGSCLAFPFKLAGKAVEGLVMGVITVVKIAVLVILFPTLIWLGIQFQAQMATEDSLESGAAKAVVSGRRIVSGVADGATEEIPEKAAGERGRRDPDQASN